MLEYTRRGLIEIQTAPGSAKEHSTSGDQLRKKRPAAHVLLPSRKRLRFKQPVLEAGEEAHATHRGCDVVGQAWTASCKDLYKLHALPPGIPRGPVK